MKYSSMVIAAALAGSGMAFATNGSAVTEDRFVDNMVECISDFIASEQDEASREQYIADCMQAKAPRALQPASGKG